MNYGRKMVLGLFAWEACRECILTIDKLMIKGLMVVNKCDLCMNAAESCNHNLL